MAHILDIPGFSDERGTLRVLEKVVPFEIKRVYFIHCSEGTVRGGHRHKSTTQALICINGACVISNHDGNKKQDFILDSSSKCLILNPEDWHIMHEFKNNATLLVLASTLYDVNDYIDEPYE